MEFSLKFSRFTGHIKILNFMTSSKFFPKSLFLFLFVVAPLFISCKDNETTTPDQSTETTQEATLEQKKQMLNNAAPTNSGNSNSGSMTGLNPEHGQPGHRCDIAVGAPLSGKAGSPSVAPIKNQANASPVKTANGLNPAHGQPGHRCDIKVGDPL